MNALPYLYQLPAPRKRLRSLSFGFLCFHATSDISSCCVCLLLQLPLRQLLQPPHPCVSHQIGCSFQTVIDTFCANAQACSASLILHTWKNLCRSVDRMNALQKLASIYTSLHLFEKRLCSFSFDFLCLKDAHDIGSCCVCRWLQLPLRQLLRPLHPWARLQVALACWSSWCFGWLFFFRTVIATFCASAQACSASLIRHTWNRTGQICG